MEAQMQVHQPSGVVGSFPQAGLLLQAAGAAGASGPESPPYPFCPPRLHMHAVF